VEVDHIEFVARYGEVQKALGPGIKAGAEIAYSDANQPGIPRQASR